MSSLGIILAAVIVGGTGIVIGLFLGCAGCKLAVEVDPREQAILEALPGNNCGGCGYPGCAGLAVAIAKGEASTGQCPVGGAAVAEKIADIMGEAVVEQVRRVAFVRCAGETEKIRQEYQYFGKEDCCTMEYVQNQGAKTCKFGCHGYGSCVQACPFDAIHIVNGVAKVDRDACKACNKCVETCPRHLIELVPYDYSYMVQCNSKEKGKTVMSACDVGCIGCKMCEKACQYDAVHVEENIARIDPEKCAGCGECARKCPKKIIMSEKII